jgi:cytidine deaminase
MALNKSITFTYQEFPSVNLLPDDLKIVAIKAKDALLTSYSPYSEFAVGAAIMLDNGDIIQGSNQENGAYPSGLCAERVALFYVGASYPGVKIKTMAIAASYKGVPISEPVTPCGACRQVMIETQNQTNSPYSVVMIGEKRVFVVSDARFLLPFTFSNVIDAAKD